MELDRSLSLNPTPVRARPGFIDHAAERGPGRARLERRLCALLLVLAALVPTEARADSRADAGREATDEAESRASGEAALEAIDEAEAPATDGAQRDTAEPHEGAPDEGVPDEGAPDGTEAMDAAREPSWALTGTSTAPLPGPQPAVRVERRLLQKEGRLAVRAGFSYLSRGDLYTNPGVSLDVTFHLFETLGLDLISATGFFSKLGSTAAALRTTTGLLPDSQRPYARVATGARYAFAYGKLLLESIDLVVHMDASLSAHLGVFVTDRAANPGGDLGLALQALVGARTLVFLDARFWVGYEDRETTALAGGPMATLGAGYLF